MTISEKREARKAEKALEREEAKSAFRLNQIKPATNALFNALFVVLSFICLFPVAYVVMISVSSEESIRLNGYALIPETFSSSAYMFLWNERGTIAHALFISILVTVVGTVLGVLLTTTMGYVLSRPQYRLRNFFNWVVFIPMIFNGGMIANYVVVANLLHLNDTIWCLILPLAVSSFNVIISKTFFRTTIPDSIIESAKIDGASQLTIFSRIVVPLSKPILATIALFYAVGRWNAYADALYYIKQRVDLRPLQLKLYYLIVAASESFQSEGISSTVMTNPDVLQAACIIFAAVPIICVYPFLQKYFVQGTMVGAVKE